MLYLDDGSVATSAGVAAGIDLCLHLVGRDHGALVAAQIAARCGLGTAANLRLHLARDASTTPTAYRRTYRGDGAAQRARPRR